MKSSEHDVRLHLAEQTDTDLSAPLAKVVYFVPSDLKDNINPNWKYLINSYFQEEQRFFEFQFRNNLNLRFQIYPEMVIGKYDHLFYDTTSTDHGNQHALSAVRTELTDRLFSSKGDLYEQNFVGQTGSFDYTVIIYEGTGSAAMILKNTNVGSEDVIPIKDDKPPAIILSSAFFESSMYSEFGSTILAHEICHVFGLSDSYDLDTGAEQSSDIMGEGRRRKLTDTYISRDNKKLIGFDL